MLLLAYQPRLGDGFLQRARRLQQRLWEDLEHRDVSAMWVLRELARHGPNGAAMPVVFTSALGVGDEVTDHRSQTFPERVWGVSQTPQVWLDHQVMEHDGGLLLTWDAVAAVFRPGVLDAMFAAYVAVVGSLFVVVETLQVRGLGELVADAAPGGTGVGALLGVAGLSAGAANVLNNLPAYLLLEPVAGDDVHRLAAVLVGTGVGPLLTPWASLATVLWWQRCRQALVHVPVREFLVQGAWLAPLCVGAAVLALAVAR